MTVYARQLAFAASEVATEIDKSKSRLEQFAWLGTKAFTGAISMLFLCRGGREEQFVAQACYQKAYRERFGKYGDCPDCWGPWPKSQTTLGQYHRTGSSAMDVAAKFTEGMFAEIEHARLKAYPNQAIDGYELGDLANWPKVFWSELNLTRPELADWPLWSVHQERDRIVAAIKEEFELARAKANDTETLRMVVDLDRAVLGDREHLSDDGLLQLTPRLLHGFFHRWKSKPAEGELERFNGKYLNRSALPAFQGEADGLLTYLFRILALAGSRHIDVPGLRRFCEALRHYDIPAADSLKYDAMADMARLRVAIREPVGDEPSGRDGDGPDKEGRAFTWGGHRYDRLTPGMMRVLTLLHDERMKDHPNVPSSVIARRADVSIDSGTKSQMFKLNRKGWPPIHPVTEIVVDNGDGTYRLIDPDKVPAKVPDRS